MNKVCDQPVPSTTRRDPGLDSARAGVGRWWVARNQWMSWLRRLTLLAGVSVIGAHAADDYSSLIKPALREHCFACHGALQQKAKLRLDTVAAMLAGGKSGPAIRPGHPGESLLLHRATTADATERMPPEHEGQPLPAATVAVLRTWIAAGAPAPANDTAEVDPRNHWAFQPRVRPHVPSPTRTHWTRNPIDAFIARGYEQNQLTPQPEAASATLLRRLYFDLIGEPPTPGEIDTFERDPAPDRYERTVDRLLNDPRHGERWARHWMDIWRYSDWWGLGDQLRNSQKHIWHWRDWIVESLNADVPYDEMVRLMLAADESHPTDLNQLRATGFLARNYFLFNRNQWMDETVEHVGKALLGLTLNCAKCHDHKYDPLAQTDYYRFRALFEPYHVRLDMIPGEPDLERNGIPRAFDGALNVPTYRFIRGQENQPDKSTVMLPGIPEALAFRPLEIHPVTLPSDASQTERRAWVLPTHLEAARRQRDAAMASLASTRQKHATKTVPSAEVSAELKVAEAVAALAQAEVTSVARRAAAMESSWTPDDTTARRAIAAVAAERVVAQAQAERKVAEAELRLIRAAPDKKADVEKELKTARETLDQAQAIALQAPHSTNTFTPLVGARWTPTRFLSSEKDDPTVASAPISSGRRTALAAWITDPRQPLTPRVAVNHLWARHFGTPLVATTFDFGRKGAAPTHPELLDWLASELVESGWSLKHLHRLIVNSATYRLSSSQADAGTNLQRDPDNRFWWRRAPIRLESQAVRDALLVLSDTLDATRGGPSVPPSEQADSRRRSLYFFHSNNERNLFLTTFDEAGVKECYRREQSIVPQQALALANSRQVHEAAQRIAERLTRDLSHEEATADADTAFIRRAFSVLLAISPSRAEVDACRHALKEWHSVSATNTPGTRMDPARPRLIWALLNHNDFVTLR